MIAISKLENKYAILFLSFIALTFIGTIDYLNNAELTLSIFYLIPLSFHALYKGTTKTFIIINSVFAAFIWVSVVYLNKFYSNNFYTFWNGLIELAFFLITGLLLFFLKEEHKKIHEINKRLTKLNDEKNKFIGIAAHDLRNPISIINSYSDLLLTDYIKNSSPEISEIVGSIKSMSNNTLVLLSNLLNVSLIESGKVNLVLKMQDYLDFVNQIIYINQIIADKKEILIKLESSEETIVLNFDEYYLSEVVNNFLSNAMKFSNENSTILIRISKTKNNSVLTEVIDNGKGIPHDEQTKLFNYFQTTSTTPTAGESSTGLGLAIAKKIIIEHNGQIGVKSSVGNGSNFYYELS